MRFIESIGDYEDITGTGVSGMAPFAWGKPVNGEVYRIIKNDFIFDGTLTADRSAKRTRSVTALAAQKDRILKIYQPLQESLDIYHHFSNLQTNDEILQFARTYGRLGLKRYATHLGSSSIKKNPEQMDSWAEPLNEWRALSRKMKRLIELKDYLDEQAMLFKSDWGRLIWNEDNTFVHYCNPAFKEQRFELWSIDKDTKSYKLFESHNSKRAIELYLEKDLNALLKEHTQIKIYLTEDKRQMQQWGMYMMPQTLFGAMLLLFADVLAGQVKYTKCMICGGPIVSRLVSRGHKKYTCSDKCRKAKSRREKTKNN